MIRNKVRWGIIGCGDVTEVKSGPGFQVAEGSELVAVMRRTPGLAADYAARHGVPKSYEDADELITDPEVDAVYIATPPGTHLEYALKVCSAGKPAYVEKPMARNYAECLAMKEAFHEANLPLFVAYYRRALPRFVNARDVIQSGAIGTLTGISYQYSSEHHRDVQGLIKALTTGKDAVTDETLELTQEASLPWRYRAEEAGGGLFLDLGCHTLDIIDYISGALADIHGVASNISGHYRVEDTVALSFRNEHNVVGTAQWNFTASRRADEILFTGDKGYFTISTFGHEPARLVLGEQVTEYDLPNPRHIQAPMIQQIVDTLLGRGKCASVGETAARTSQVIDAALQSFYGGRSDEFWLRPESWPR